MWKDRIFGLTLGLVIATAATAVAASLYIDIQNGTITTASGTNLVMGTDATTDTAGLYIDGTAKATASSAGMLWSAMPRTTMTVTDNDATDNTLSVAEWVGGITVHTSVTGGGTVTTDTATNMVAGSSSVGALAANDQCSFHYYVNDGDQTLTLAGGTGVTVADTGNTILINEAAVLIFCRDSATTGTLYTVSS